MANENAKQGVADMALLFKLLRAYNVLDRVRSLNRYYMLQLTFYCKDFL